MLNESKWLENISLWGLFVSFLHGKGINYHSLLKGLPLF